MVLRRSPPLWALMVAPSLTKLFETNDEARAWHAANLGDEGSFRVIYRWNGGEKGWDPEWDMLAEHAMKEGVNILHQPDALPGEVNWALVEELEDACQPSWEELSDFNIPLEFISDVEAGRARGI